MWARGRAGSEVGGRQAVSAICYSPARPPRTLVAGSGGSRIRTLDPGHRPRNRGRWAHVQAPTDSSYQEHQMPVTITLHKRTMAAGALVLAAATAAYLVGAANRPAAAAQTVYTLPAANQNAGAIPRITAPPSG